LILSIADDIERLSGGRRWLRLLIAVTTRRLKLVLKLHDWYQDTRLGMRAVKGFQTEHMTRVITDNIYSKFCSFSEYKKPF